MEIVGRETIYRNRNAVRTNPATSRRLPLQRSEGASNRTEGWRYVTWLTDIDRWLCHRAAMSKLVTQAELLEIVPELRAMAAAEPTDNVREALNRLVDRYAAMGRENTLPTGLGAHQPNPGAASVY
jgi:hypothetical protein